MKLLNLIYKTMVPKHLVSTYDMIDHLTKFRVSCVIKNKQKERVVPNLLDMYLHILLTTKVPYR